MFTREGDIMSINHTLPIDANMSQEIVDDLNQTYELLDAAMIHALRTSANLIETGRKIGLDPKSGQKLFSELAACTGAMVESRQNLVSVHQQAHRIRMRSTAAHVRMVGCPYPFIEDGESVPAKLAAVA
jgi:hypothetical protein